MCILYLFYRHSFSQSVFCVHFNNLFRVMRCVYQHEWIKKFCTYELLCCKEMKFCEFRWENRRKFNENPFFDHDVIKTWNCVYVYIHIHSAATHIAWQWQCGLFGVCVCTMRYCMCGCHNFFPYFVCTLVHTRLFALHRIDMDVLWMLFWTTDERAMYASHFGINTSDIQHDITQLEQQIKI